MGKEQDEEDHVISCDSHSPNDLILVDIIVPVYNAERTLNEAVDSAMTQRIPEHLVTDFINAKINISVCCFDDGSTDDSWDLLQRLQAKYSRKADARSAQANTTNISSKLYIRSSDDGVARGAGYARNRAVEIRNSIHDTMEETNSDHHFLCLLDSDDTMHPTRVAEQVSCMMSLCKDERKRTLLGCNFDRDPPESTWHYAKWANGLSHERLMLERFREVTIIQPTWMMCRSRWEECKGYVEALPTNVDANQNISNQNYSSFLIHPDHDTSESIKLAEDLRFFHCHLYSNGLLRLHKSEKEASLVTYRHSGSSQSFRTPRKLLLQLRVLAFENSILRCDEHWQQHDGKFVVWGAGRDGKVRQQTCFDDVKYFQP